MFKLDTHRTYKTPVSATVLLPDGSEQIGEFTATFKVLPFDQQKALSEQDGAFLLKEALVDLSDIELTENGEVLKGQALLDAAINDPDIALAISEAFSKSIEKKTPTRS